MCGIRCVVHRRRLNISAELQQLLNLDSTNDTTNEDDNNNSNNNNSSSNSIVDNDAKTTIETNCSVCDSEVAISEQFLRRRGPNACAAVVILDDETKQFDFKRRIEPDVFRESSSINDNNHNNIAATIIASVLSMRGSVVVGQPIVNETMAFAWNGEVFRCPQLDDLHNGTVNDTQLLFDAIVNCWIENDNDSSLQRLSSLFYSIEGPYAFVLYHKPTKTIYFGRDRLGRRSLLLNHCQASFCLSSVATFVCDNDNNEALSNAISHWIELPPRGIYAISLAESSSSNGCSLRLIPWYIDRSTPTQSNLATQWNPIPYRTLDDATLQSMRHSGAQRWPAPSNETDDECGSDNGACCDLLMSALVDAVRVRVENAPYCLPSSNDDNDLDDDDDDDDDDDNDDESIRQPSRVAILFSGGVDSALLAALTDIAFRSSNENNIDDDDDERNTSPIDLINVSFGGANAPDRISGLAAYEELRRIAPRRQWRLVLVDVDVTDSSDGLRRWQSTVQTLCAPLYTVMDVTIGAALWFGARGIGRLYPSNKLYRSRAKILLTGHGADEQFGGYHRLRTRLAKGGWSAVRDDLLRDQSRIWRRNLGRDDRLISDWSREMRCPFLDERVGAALSTLPIEAICNLARPEGVGDKHLLRRAARRVGLTASTRLEKRAIQFGTRVAASYRTASRSSQQQQHRSSNNNANNSSSNSNSNNNNANSAKTSEGTATYRRI